ncbi:MAG: hypothetical protein AMXMBFR84_02800 [Candidatus Hydrogenedentota bacterium]
MKVLNKKLLRTMWKTRGQTLAVILVVLCGTACFICLASAHRNLLLTRDTYYSQNRFANFEIMLERAPRTALFKLETLPSVRRVEARIVKDVNVDIEGLDKPRVGRIVSMPETNEGVLNDVVLVEGKYFDEGVTDQVIMSERFAETNGLALGDRVQISVNSKKYSLRIVGLGLSPEFVYMIRNVQELVPAPERFGILWVPETFAETALNMRSACNNVVGTVDSEDDLDSVLDAAEKILKPYGVFIKAKRDDMISHRFLADEIRGLEVSAKVIPTIFLGIAALILLILLNRMVRKERTEIGLLKAYGYSDFAVALHYLKYALFLGVTGCLGGFVVGQYLANLLIKLYVQFYQFPLLESRIYPEILARSMGIAMGFSTVGALWAALSAAAIDPALSMRPESPKSAHTTLIERIPALWRRLTFTWKMIVRNVSRNAFRAALNSFGVMVSTGLMMVGTFSIDSITYALHFQFQENRREDVKISFPIERGKEALYESMRFDHVQRAEPLLQYPVELQSAWRSKDVIVIGVPLKSKLHRMWDLNHRPIEIATRGITLSERLARDMRLKVGDIVRVKPLMGRVTDETDLPVTRIVSQYIGSYAYMQIETLSGLLKQSFAMNSAMLQVENGRERDVNRILKDIPGISSVELKEESYASMLGTLRRNMKVTNTMLVIFAAVIAFSIIYNVTTVALAERQRELASLRVLGFSTAETGRIMYHENFLLAVFGIIFGIPFGMGICRVLVSLYDNELYRLPYHIEPRTYAYSICMTIFFVSLANLAVRHKILSLDMVEVLKQRE